MTSDTQTALSSTAKIFIPKVLASVVGYLGAAVVQHVWFATENPEKFSTFEHGEHVWLVQSRQALAEFLAVPANTLNAKFGPLARLTDTGVIVQEVATDNKCRKISMWRVDHARLRMLLGLAYQLHFSRDEVSWLAFLAQNQERTKSFSFTAKGGRECVFPCVSAGKKATAFKNRVKVALSASEQKFGLSLVEEIFGSNGHGGLGWITPLPPVDYTPTTGVLHPYPPVDYTPVNTSNGLLSKADTPQLECIELNSLKPESVTTLHGPSAQEVDFSTSSFGNNKPSKPESIGSRLMRKLKAQSVTSPEARLTTPKHGQTNEFVEHWNSQPHVPKCRPGTKAYLKASQFFEAHRRYRAGQAEFILTADEQARLQLAKINRTSSDAKNPMRPRTQMLAHIEKAAKIYNPEYAPADKRWLPRALVQFLFNDHSKKYGQSSLFLEQLKTRPPQLLSESTYEGLEANATDAELAVVDMIKCMYDLANGRDSAQELDLREFKQALSVSRNILKEYMKIPVTRVDIFASHFGDWREFMQWWIRYTEDHIWEGMPITAMDVGKNMWRAFVDFVSNDIGYHLISGRRV